MGNQCKSNTTTESNTFCCGCAGTPSNMDEVDKWKPEDLKIF